MKRPSNPTPAAEVLAAYEWTFGPACFRCGRADVDTAPVGQVLPEDGAVEVPACPSCTLVLERHREDAAERYGWSYRPGTPADERHL